MSTGYYLLDHRVAHRPKWYTTRRGSILGILVHITAGLEDLDATDDHSAERTAAYAANTERKVSWHSGSDTDSAFDLLPDGFTAFHVKGYNSRLIGHEISKRHTNWDNVSKKWRDRTLVHAARHLAVKALRHGIPIRKATRAELDRAIAHGGGPVGFLSHWELDPGRRSDPGLSGGRDTFPWHEFLELVRHYAGQSPTEENDVYGTKIIAAYGEAGYDLSGITDKSRQVHRDIGTWTDEIYAKPEAERAGGVAYIRALLGLSA